MSAQVLRLHDHRPAPLTAEEARKLTDKIRTRLADLLPLIKEAFERRADVALGYATWPDYCDAELRGIRLPVSDRRELVAELRKDGHSIRTIAGAVGADKNTVLKDIRRLSETQTDALPEKVRSLDGRERPAARPTDVPAGPDGASPPAAPEPPGRPGTQVTPVGADGGVGVTRDAGTDAAPRPDDHQECVRCCRDRVYALSSDGLCDGCVEEAANAAQRPVHVTLTQREADLLTTYAADILDSFEGEDRDTLLAAIGKVGDALIAARTAKQSGPVS